MLDPFNIVVVFILSLVLAFIMYFLQQKTIVKRKTLNSFFTGLSALSVLLMAISILAGGWTGLGLGAVGTYIGVPSIITLLVLNLMGRDE